MAGRVKPWAEGRTWIAGLAAMMLAALPASAQVAAGSYVGSVEFQNICSNSGQGSDSSPVQLSVASNGVQTYLFTNIYAAGSTGSGTPVTQGGYSLIKLTTEGKWSSEILVYGAGYNGASTQTGTWTQTFTTSGGIVTGTGTFDIIVGGQVVCSEPTSSVFMMTPKGL